jgi:hypothetical protein
MWAVNFTLANLLKVHTLPTENHPSETYFIGTDKAGHFLGEGLKYYQMIHAQGKTLQQALQWGIRSEREEYGLDMNGIFSWGDLVSNYEGLLFWEEVVPRWYHCQNGRWSRTRPFQIEGYLNAGWDEAYNCPEFRTTQMRDSTYENIRELERTRGQTLMCPISSEKCDELREHYGALAPFLLSPLCR